MEPSAWFGESQCLPSTAGLTWDLLATRGAQIVFPFCFGKSHLRLSSPISRQLELSEDAESPSISFLNNVCAHNSVIFERW